MDVLLARIARAASSYEQHIEPRLPERLNEAYARFFHEYEAAPLLDRQCRSDRPDRNDADYEELLGATHARVGSTTTRCGTRRCDAAASI